MFWGCFFVFLRLCLCDLTAHITMVGPRRAGWQPQQQLLTLVNTLVTQAVTQNVTRAVTQAVPSHSLQISVGHVVGHLIISASISDRDSDFWRCSSMILFVR